MKPFPSLSFFRLGVLCALCGSISASAATPLPNAKLSGASEVTSGTFTIKSGASFIIEGGGVISGMQPLDAALTSLSGVSNAANKLPYFTSPDTFGTVSFSPYSQTLLPLTTSSAWRTAIFPAAPATGDLAYYNGSAWVSLPRGSTGQVLTASATTVAFANAPLTGASTTSSYILAVADSTLPNSFALGSLGTGLLMNTTTTGTPSVAAAGTDYVAPGAAITSGLTQSSGKLLGRASASSGPIEELSPSAGLDLIGSTRGSILYRGASGWVALAPGSIGYVLTSGGAGADPTYTASSGGGGSATLTTLTWASSLAISFSNSDQTVTLTGNTTFTTSNLSAAAPVLLRIVCDSTGRTLTFPSGWTWVGGSAPSAIAASKIGLLSLVSYSTTDTSVVAAYAVQP